MSAETGDWRDAPNSTRAAKVISSCLDYDEAETLRVIRELVASGFLRRSRGRSLAALSIDDVFFVAAAVIGRMMGCRRRDCAGFAHSDPGVQEALNAGMRLSGSARKMVVVRDGPVTVSLELDGFLGRSIAQGMESRGGG